MCKNAFPDAVKRVTALISSGATPARVYDEYCSWQQRGDGAAFAAALAGETVVANRALWAHLKSFAGDLRKAAAPSLSSPPPLEGERRR